MNLTQLRSELDKRKGRRDAIQEKLEKLKQDIEDIEIAVRRHEQARAVLQEAGLKTQQGLSYHIGEITTLALDTVFDDPYTLEVEFVERRNKTECDLYFVRNGKRIEPMEASGGGTVDVASFALRIASWSMQHPHVRNVIILDEPLKYLSNNLQDKGSAMLREVSKRLGIQFIIVTHEETLTSFADRIFKVRIKNGVSKVEQIENEVEEY